ncbi:hypothetical protein J2S74_004972 [Evansella vedderi]|uniref:Uncharacterized protein n=1 Tax=Evansella vedderi TaxID=38282 RepID=A0ABU0A339_9BACI|nr:hypothetical protein [Evansella vedderi]MDQ0257514.1 hypothetical protein [Evansella vedderi]
MYQCPTCKRQTLEGFTDKKTGEGYYMCDNKGCPDYGKQITDIEVVQ